MSFLKHPVFPHCDSTKCIANTVMERKNSIDEFPTPRWPTPASTKHPIASSSICARCNDMLRPLSTELPTQSRSFSDYAGQETPLFSNCPHRAPPHTMLPLGRFPPLKGSTRPHQQRAAADTVGAGHRRGNARSAAAAGTSVGRAVAALFGWGGRKRKLLLNLSLELKEARVLYAPSMLH
jgi:hypothetical protein